MIIKAKDFDYKIIEDCKILPRPRGNQGGRKARYLDLVTAFDIETTNVPEIEQSFMYIWQMQLGPDLTLIGRDWDSYIQILQGISKRLPDNVYMVQWIHNASFEFQFIKGIYHFEPDEVFCLESRKIAKFTMFDHIEYRCSYIHSNMSLAEFTHKMGVPDSKLSGYDYTKQRYPWTPLTDFEIQYCINDVKGLVQALIIEMAADGDNLYTVPLTSTGYVRRDCKQAMKQYNHKQLYAMLPDAELYLALREAFRGGNTHASRWYAGEILEDVTSFDRSSSYPDVMVNCLYPMGPFFHEGGVSFQRLKKLIEVRHKAVLFRIAFYDLKLKDRYDGAPYLSRDKGRNIQGAVFDNGRILSCDYACFTLTDLDWKIILKHYTWSGCNPYDVWHARYGKLPKPLTDTVKHYYRLKTELKNVPGQEIYYLKSKNKLNSLYGMTATSIKDRIEYLDESEDPYQAEDRPLEDLIKENNKKAFLSYAWG